MGSTNTDPSSPAAALWFAARLITATMAGGACFASLYIGAFAAHDLSRLAQLLAMAVCAMAWLGASMRSWRSEAPPVHRGWAIGGLCVALALIASSALAARPAMAFRELALWLGVLSMAVAYAEITGIEAWRRWVVALGSLATLYGVIVTIVIVLAAVQGLAVRRAELFFGYDNFRFFNHVQTVSLPVVLIGLAVLDAQAPTRRRKWLRGWLWAGGICSFALLWIASGRATGLGLLGGAAAAVACLGSRVRPMMQRAALAASAGTVLYGLLMYGLPLLTGNVAIDTTRELGDPGGYETRLYLWKLAWSQAMASPWFGAGPMHFAHVPNVEGAHPHNVYVQWVAECGWPVAIACVLAAGLAIGRLMRYVRTASTPWRQDVGAGLVMACVAVAIDAAFSGNLVMPLSQMWIAILGGLCVAWCRLEGRRPQELSMHGHTRTARRLAIVGAAAVVATQWALMASVWPEATDLEAHLARVNRELSIAPRANPRFWSVGWF